MESIAFALPLKQGKSAELKSFVDEFSGPRAAEYHDSRKQHGLTALKVWHQKSPQEMLIIYIEAENLEEFMINRGTSGHPVTDWLDSKLDEFTGGHHPLVEMVADWHAEYGHRLKRAKPA